MKKLSSEYRRAWRELTGSTMAESAWGMTETQICNSFTADTQGDNFGLRSQPIFVGLPAPDTDFKICDFGTRDLVPIGAEGELCIHTSTLLRGYWNEPKVTAQALRNGWFRAGDIDYIDEQGYVHYLGRRKEMLKVNDMSMFPAEIEAMLDKHPAILGPAVVSRAGEHRGQLPVAFVMLRPEIVGTLDSATLTGWCRKNMTGYKVPIVHIVDILPFMATGKVRKQDLAPFAGQF